VQKSRGVVIVAAVLMGLAACSDPARDHSQQTRGGERHETARLQTTATKRDTGAPILPQEPTVSEETASVTKASASWDYVALGDSLAAGVGARRGYVDRYAAHIESDTGTPVDVINLGRSGETSSELLYALRNDSAMRQALGAAEVVTFNIGINDLGHAGEAHKNGACGGGDNLECLRAAVEAFKGNLDAIVGELLSLRSTEDTIIRTAGIGYTPRVDPIFEPYVDEVYRHVATAAASRDIAHAQPYLGKESMNADGVHPNDDGYAVIADRLRGLGYAPLGSPR
jgi:lysophospholipase L1-like esterase